jgi:hypothetical protein
LAVITNNEEIVPVVNNMKQRKTYVKKQPNTIGVLNNNVKTQKRGRKKKTV